MKAPQFREVRIADLKQAKFNPAQRTGPRAIAPLVNSIGKIGLMYPILIGKDYGIIDGHRRVAAYKELGLETIPAIIKVGDSSDEEVYADVNWTARKMSGNEALQVYLKEPKAINTFFRNRFDRMVEVLGMPRVRQMAKQGMTFQIYLIACKIAAYCSQDATSVPAIVDWLMKHQPVGMVMSAMASGQSPAPIIKACKAGRTLKFKAIVS